MSHTGSSTVAWQQSRVSSHGSKRARVAKQRHLMSRFDLMHAGKFVTGFIPCVFPHTYLVHLSTVDDSKISYPSWVNIQSAGWINIQSALTLEGTGQQLPLQIHREESRAGVDVFVTRHLLLQNINQNQDLDIWIGSRHDAVLIDFFYSFVRPLLSKICNIYETYIQFVYAIFLDRNEACPESERPWSRFHRRTARVRRPHFHL